MTGNLESASDVTPSRLAFRPFVENRITIPVRRKEPESTPVGKLEIVNDTDTKIHAMPLIIKQKKKL